MGFPVGPFDYIVTKSGMTEIDNFVKNDRSFAAAGLRGGKKHNLEGELFFGIAISLLVESIEWLNG